MDAGERLNRTSPMLTRETEWEQLAEIMKAQSMIEILLLFHIYGNIEIIVVSQTYIGFNRIPGAGLN